MNNFIPQASPSSPSSPNSGGFGVSSPNAFSFLSKGWREVRDSADADLRLMRDRAKSFKEIASSVDREIENFIHSASATFTTTNTNNNNMEIDFVKKLQPKISEFRRVYSAQRGGKTKLGIDLSAIRNAIREEVELEGTRKWERTTEWEPIRVLKERWREMEEKRTTEERWGAWNNKELLEKLKEKLVRELEGTVEVRI